jgi:hypothetical protein
VSGLQRLPRGASRRAWSRVQLSVEQEREHRLPADGVDGPVALGRFKQERGEARAGVPGGGAVLIRPDGFIGFRAIPADPAGLDALAVHLATYLIEGGVSS